MKYCYVILFAILFFFKQNAKAQISYGFQLGMVAYETPWNKYKPVNTVPFNYSSIDLLPTAKLGFLSEYVINKKFAIEFLPALTIHNTVTHGRGLSGFDNVNSNNVNFYKTRAIEMPLIAKFSIPVTNTVKWSTGAGLGLDVFLLNWQQKGPMNDYYDNSPDGNLSNATIMLEEHDNLLFKKSIVPFITCQTGLDIFLKKKNSIYVGMEGHFQTMKNFRMQTEMIDHNNPSKNINDIGPAFNTNYFLVKVGYWIRKKSK